jgi:hypothetical protein
VTRPKRSRIASSKVIDPDNRSTPALSSHVEAAIAAQLAAATAAKAKATAGGSGSLSTIGGTSNSRSVSPGKRNVDNAALSSPSSGSEESSAQAKRQDKGKQRGETTDNAIISLTDCKKNSRSARDQQ